jgi:N-acylneuraminate cytidylyltransferase
MKYIVLIPARGGSQRLPRKNLLPLAGKPLIAYSIDYAKQNGIPVYVSTDDPEIKEISIRCGANVIDRPAELATNAATTAMVLKHATEYLLNNGVDFDYVILLQATNPLRPKDMLREAMAIVETEKPNSLMGVNPILRKQGRIIDNRYVPINYKFGQRSQDMETWYYENGLIYFTSKEKCLEGVVMTPDARPFIVDHIFGKIDIDAFDDFQMAEYFMSKYMNN